MSATSMHSTDRPARRAAGAPRRALAPVAAALALALAGCGDGDEDYDYAGSREAFEDERATLAAEASAPQALFDPGAGELPFPIDLLFGASEDGTLDAPVELGEDGEPANPADPTISLNQMDGFSTVAPITASVSEALDPETVRLGETVRVFRLNAADDPEGPVGGELGADEVLVRADGERIAIVPLTPLQPATRHLVVLTNGIEGADGMALERALFYDIATRDTEFTEGLAEFEPVRAATNPQLAVAASQGIDPQSVALSWTFRTQSIREPLQAAADAVVPQRLVVAPAPRPDGAEGRVSTADANPALRGSADIWVGTLDLPYYRPAASPDDPESFAAAIDGVWRNAADAPVNPTDWTPVARGPGENGTVRVPVLMTVPNGAPPPEGGFPVTIFQHGITGDRTNMLAVADTLAEAGRVTIAIDQPMHGVTDTEGVLAALNAANTPFPEDVERHFGIDVQANDGTGAPGADGEVDDSGAHFINLANLGATRDNLRQAASDLLVLSASVGGALVPDGAGGALPAAEAGLVLNAGAKSFLGHSLGGIVGTTMLSFDPSFEAGSLAMPGGGIAQLLAASQSFGPVIEAGLAGAGIEPGSADFERFLLVAQTVIDSGDPINHARFLATDPTTGLHLVQVDGDRTIPNSVATAPLSGTEPLARTLGLPRVADTASGNRAFVRFTEASSDHGTILRPAELDSGLAATAEMQRQVAGFAASSGQTLPIEDTSVIVPLDDAQGGR